MHGANIVGIIGKFCFQGDKGQQSQRISQRKSIIGVELQSVTPFLNLGLETLVKIDSLNLTSRPEVIYAIKSFDSVSD
jgi:hypothetical protein